MAQEFKNLEQALVFYSDFTHSEILLANTGFSYLGLFERLRSFYEQKRIESAVSSLARGLGIRIASSSQIAELDLGKINNPEIKRLMLKLKVLPLDLVTENSEKKLLLASSDPFFEHARSCFAKFYSCKIEMVLALESDIQKKLMYISEGSGAYQSLSESSTSSPIIKFSENENITNFENLLTETFKFGASSFNIEFEKERILVALATEKKKKNLNLKLDPENFVAFLLENSQLIEVNENGFSAWCRHQIFKQSLSFKAQFYKKHKNNAYNVLELSDFSFNSLDELKRFFLEINTSSSGIYLIEGNDNPIISVIKRAFPGSRFPTFDQLLAKKEYLLISKISPLFVSRDNIKEIISKIPNDIKSEISGVIYKEEYLQTCGFCQDQSCSLCRAFSSKLNLCWLENGDNSVEKQRVKIDSLIRKNAKVVGKTQDSPLFARPREQIKKTGFHSVILKMNDSMLLKREEAKSPEVKSNYHSVVLDLGQDLKELRDKLKKEESEK